MDTSPSSQYTNSRKRLPEHSKSTPSSPDPKKGHTYPFVTGQAQELTHKMISKSNEIQNLKQNLNLHSANSKNNKTHTDPDQNNINNLNENTSQNKPAFPLITEYPHMISPPYRIFMQPIKNVGNPELSPD